MSNEQKVSYKGGLEEYPFPRLLQALYEKELTGRLVLHRGEITKVVFFVAGSPVNVDSTLRDETLGRYLVKMGRISEEDYEKSIELMIEKGIQQGAALVKLKCIPPKQLYQEVKAQTREKLITCFGWVSGTFEFYPEIDFVEDMYRFEMPVPPLMREGINRFFPKGAIESQLVKVGPGPILPLDGFMDKINDYNLSDEETAFIMEIDGERDLVKLKEETKSYPFAVKLIYLLLVTGLAGPNGEKEENIRSLSGSVPSALDDEESDELSFASELGDLPGSDLEASIGSGGLDLDERSDLFGEDYLTKDESDRGERLGEEADDLMSEEVDTSALLDEEAETEEDIPFDEAETPEETDTPGEAAPKGPNLDLSFLDEEMGPDISSEEEVGEGVSEFDLSGGDEISFSDEEDISGGAEDDFGFDLSSDADDSGMPAAARDEMDDEIIDEDFEEGPSVSIESVDDDKVPEWEKLNKVEHETPSWEEEVDDEEAGFVLESDPGAMEDEILDDEDSGEAGGEDRLLYKDESEILEFYMTVKSADFFSLLGVERGAGDQQVEESYRRLMSEFDASKFPPNISMELYDKLEEINTQIIRAYEALKNEAGRARYQAKLEGKPDPGAVISDNLQAEQYLQKGMGFVRQKEWAKAQEMFEKAVEKKPREPDYRAYLGWTIYSNPGMDLEERRAKALDYLNQAIELNPNNDAPHVFMAKINKDAGDVEAAVAEFERALKLNPNCKEAERELKARRDGQW